MNGVTETSDDRLSRGIVNWNGELVARMTGFLRLKINASWKPRTCVLLTESPYLQSVGLRQLDPRYADYIPTCWFGFFGEEYELDCIFM